MYGNYKGIQFINLISFNRNIFYQRKNTKKKGKCNSRKEKNYYYHRAYDVNLILSAIHSLPSGIPVSECIADKIK